MNAGFEYREQIGPEAAGRTVLAWLAARYRHSTEVAWRERIASGAVRLDGEAALAMDVLRPGQSLVWRRPPWEEPPVPHGFAVLHREQHLLAVAKPRGLPSVPNGGFLEHTLLFRVRRLHPEAVPMHRLGRGTSGLVLFARTDAARRAVAAEWRAGRVEKEYRALVTGRPVSESFTIDTPIGLVPHPRLGRVHAASPAGRAAVSHVHVLARRDGATLVAVSIPTGRPHQVRIHLAAAGHPLVGDPLYVEGGVPGPDPALPGEGGYRLHSHRLALAHPLTGRRLELECPPPPELRT
ncbi:MAG TPA: RluA family pseudouridine synthase [Vicinamibacteria bacterium]|nr:RluA family pseudouridine synthase [Vicinamibacteria bacterium]